MNPLWWRAQELQKRIDLTRSKSGSGRLPWLYLSLGTVRERLASERLAKHNPQGWVDRFAAITAYALAGAGVRAERLRSSSREQAEGWPLGRASLAEQHAELEAFLRKQALEPVGTALHGATSPSDVDHVLRLARAQWPEAVVDSGEGAPRRVDAALRGRWSVPCDFSLHETKEAHDSWAAEGPTATNLEQMVLTVVERGRICLIADEQAVKAGGLAKDMFRALKENRRLANAEHWPVNAPEEAALGGEHGRESASRSVRTV